jgi:hypothetical protein
VRGVQAPIVVTLAVLMVVGSATAATYRPTRHDDPPPGRCKAHDCSLREAVRKANRHAGRERILLGKGRYRLTIPEAPADPNDSSAGDLDVTGELKLIGRGPQKTAVSGESLHRILHLQGSLNSYEVRKLTIRNGDAGTGDGGGILGENIGGLTALRSVVLKQNAAARGAGIWSAADIQLFGSTVTGGTASQSGGGIFLPATSGGSPAVGELQYSTISHNHTDGVGGGVALDGFDVGGFPNAPHLLVRNSTLALNDADVSGGGVSAIQGADASVYNSTLAHNTADADGSGGGNGGGVYQSTGAGFTLGDDVIAANSAGASGTGMQCAGAFSGLGGNVVQLQAGTSCSITGGLSEPIDALIGPLADNGGPTKTVRLLAGSPAIGVALDCPATDQRGRPRPATGCDSGAFERVGP